MNGSPLRHRDDIDYLTANEHCASFNWVTEWGMHTSVSFLLLHALQPKKTADFCYVCIGRTLDFPLCIIFNDYYLEGIHQTSPREHSPNAESIATLPPFGPIEGHKWFFQISSQLKSQKNRFAFISFVKIQFLPPCIWDLSFMSYRLWEELHHIRRKIQFFKNRFTDLSLSLKIYHIDSLPYLFWQKLVRLKLEITFWIWTI